MARHSEGGPGFFSGGSDQEDDGIGVRLAFPGGIRDLCQFAVEHGVETLQHLLQVAQEILQSRLAESSGTDTSNDKKQV